MNNPFCITWSPRLLSTLRIVAAFLFLLHGSQKLFGVPPSEHVIQHIPIVVVAGVLEFGGGLLLLFGLFTRPTAFILSGQMAVAYFMAHAPKGALPIQNGGELAVLYCFIFLYFAAAGGGAWSVDHCCITKNPQGEAKAEP